MTMSSRLLRAVAMVTVLSATIAFFIYYFVSQPSVREQLGRLSWPVLALLLGLYLLTVVALAGITIASLRLCDVALPGSESFLITAYSSIVNFFGPLQSGPAFRAVYLKKKYGLNLKNFAAATFMYYFFFALFSGIFLFSSSLKFWLIPLVAGGLLVLWLIWRHSRVRARVQNLDLHGWYYLAFATLFQVCLMVLIYYTELVNVAPGTQFWQAIVYTGAANMALFVSLTPGAIGFREAFLVFSKHLHHISSSTIVAANIIDRAMYIMLLLIMALFIFGTHAQRQLKVKD